MSIPTYVIKVIVKIKLLFIWNLNYCLSGLSGILELKYILN